MIRVTKFDGTALMLNADWIQSIESTPDTLVTLTNGSKIFVRDAVEEVVKAFKEYKLELSQNGRVVVLPGTSAEAGVTPLRSNHDQ